MADKSIKTLAKETIALFDSAKSTKQFSNMFCRNLIKRINEHVKLTDLIFNNIRMLDKHGNSLFESLDKKITNKTFKTVVNKQLVLELKRRENLLLIKENVTYLNELFTLIKALNFFTTKEKYLIESTIKQCSILSAINAKEENDKAIKQFLKIKKNINEMFNFITKRIQRHLNETITEISDMGDAAAESVKMQNKDILKWWVSALHAKE
ncbi:MAG: hypothetical protein AABY22_03245, partial [Nanoarchaeota archaeon]